MLKRYRISVNGHAYDVEVEELPLAGSSLSPGRPADKGLGKPLSSAPPPSSTRAQMVAPPGSIPPPPPAGYRASGGDDQIRAPMPGTILAVMVKLGQSVKRGDILLTLEAMKMENEIMASRDGRIKEVPARPGATVNTGDALVVFD